MINSLINFIKRYPYTFVFQLPLEIFIRRFKGPTISLAYGIHQIGIKALLISRKIVLRATPVTSGKAVLHQKDPFLILHQKIHKEIRAQKKEYKNYKYFFGYPYQNFNLLNIFGWRDTEERFDNYGLSDLIQPDDHILDIGCGCGFLAILASYRTGCKADGLDINTYMINIGKHCATYLKLSKKVRLYPGRFQDFKADTTYDVIFSLAAHWTDDRLHRPDFQEYMLRLHKLLSPNGLLVFESHYHDIGNPQFYHQLERIKPYFSWEGSRFFENRTRELFLMRKLSPEA